MSMDSYARNLEGLSHDPSHDCGTLGEFTGTEARQAPAGMLATQVARLAGGPTACDQRGTRQRAAAFALHLVRLASRGSHAGTMALLGADGESPTIA